MQRLYVDFNTMMSEPVDLVKLSTDKSSDHPAYHEGERVVLFDEEMEVEATILHSAKYHYWLAEPDWSTRVDLLPSAPQQGTNATL
jgi:hypothetical protein